MSESLMKRKIEKWLSGNVFYIGLASLLSDSSHEMATSILPLFLTITLGAGPAALGIVEGVSDVASSFAKPMAGYLSDMRGKRKPWMNLGYALTGFFIPVFAVATDWVQVLLLKAGAWIGRGLRGAPRDALLADSVKPADHGKAFGFHRSMDTLGAIIGPVAALLLLPILSLRQIMLVTAVGGVASFVVVVFKVKEARARQPMSVMPEDLPGRLGFREALANLPGNYQLFLLGVGIFGLSNFAPTLLSLRAYQLLVPVRGATLASVFAVGLYTFLNATYAAFSYPIGHLGDRYQKRKLLALGYLSYTVATIGFALGGADITLLIVLFGIIGFQVAIVDTIEAAYAAQLLPPSLRGTGFGALQTINGIGDLASSAIVGLLWTLFSPFLAFSYAALLSLLGGIGLLWLTRQRRQAP